MRATTRLLLAAACVLRGFNLSVADVGSYGEYLEDSSSVMQGSIRTFPAEAKLETEPGDRNKPREEGQSVQEAKSRGSTPKVEPKQAVPKQASFEGLAAMLESAVRSISSIPLETILVAREPNTSNPMYFQHNKDPLEDISDDIFAPVEQKANGDEGWDFFKSAPLREWLILVVACLILSAVDLLAIRRLPEGFWWHVGILGFWVVIACLYNIGMWLRMGKNIGLDWCTGYLLEWMLSMDNLFVFHLVFETYKTPANQIHKAVFVGIVGAVVMRMVFFMLLSTLLHLFTWVRFVFGLFLVWSGIQAARADDDDEDDVSDTALMRGLNWLLGDRILDRYDDNQAMFVYGQNGQLQVTALFVVICCLELTDILFAVDSVSAKVAQVPNQFVAFSSSVLAMYGLRAMFFIVHDLIEIFELLKYGLCAVLVFIGIELCMSKWISLPSSTVCTVICAIFGTCILATAGKEIIGRATGTKSPKKGSAASTPANSSTATPSTSCSATPREKAAAPMPESPRSIESKGTQENEEREQPAAKVEQQT